VGDSQLPSIIFAVVFVVLVGVCGALYFRDRKKGKRIVWLSRPDKPVAINAPLWPSRKPDDWELKFEIDYQKRLRVWQRNRIIDGWTRAPERTLVPSWEAHHAAEQARKPRQIRWAQTPAGDWHREIWGNPAQLPPNGGPLPVYQLMQRADNNHWTWILIGDAANVSLDWQRGHSRVEDLTCTAPDGKTFTARRPCGHPATPQAAPPMDANDERGSSDWGTADDLAGLGAVSGGGRATPDEPRSKHSTDEGQPGRDALAEALRNTAATS
jgi:hypothetical protein